MLKKWVASVLIVTLSFLCLPVFSSAAVYDINGTIVNNFLLYDNPDSVTFVFDGTEEFDLSNGSFNYNETLINSFYGSKQMTAISGSLIQIDFPTEEFIKGQSYNISFDLSSGTNGNNAAIVLPSSGGNQITAAELVIMDLEWIQKLNTPVVSWDYVLNYFSVFNKTDLDFYRQCHVITPYITELFTSTHISYDIKLPVDYISSDNSPNSIVLFFLWRSVDPQYMKLENFKITPLGATKYLFEEAQFRDDVRDGILNIEGSLDDLHSDLFEGGTSRDPAIENKDQIDNILQDEAALNKDFSADLNQQFDTAGNIFENNSSFSFISNLFQDMILSVPQLNSLVIFSLAIGLCVLILGRRLNA